MNLVAQCAMLPDVGFLVRVIGLGHQVLFHAEMILYISAEKIKHACQAFLPFTGLAGIPELIVFGKYLLMLSVYQINT